MKCKSEPKVDHFGALIGKNDYRECNRCYVLDTPNYPNYAYVLKQIVYNGNKIDHRTNIDVEKGNDHKYHFKNQNLEKIRKTTLLGEFYQGIMRTNRDNDKTTEVFIFTSERTIVNKLFELMPQAKKGKNSKMTIPTVWADKKEKLITKKMDRAMQVLTELRYNGDDQIKYFKNELYELFASSSLELEGTREVFGVLWSNLKFRRMCKDANISIQRHLLLIKAKGLEFGEVPLLGKEFS